MPPEMDPPNSNFQTFLIAKIKDRNVSLKKLVEVTGIASAHLENMVHGKFDDLPSSPYVRGYIIRLGKVLDFDGEAWWRRIKKEGLVQDSGSTDALPRNRFIGRSPAKFIWAAVAVGLMLVYAAFQLPLIFGKPSITVKFPAQNPYTTSSSTITLQGVVRSANSITLNGDGVAIAQDGSWEKSVLLQNGLNSFAITAKKLLGGEANIIQQIFYQAPPAPPSTNASATSTLTAPAKLH